MDSSMHRQICRQAKHNSTRGASGQSIGYDSAFVHVNLIILV